MKLDVPVFPMLVADPITTAVSRPLTEPVATAVFAEYDLSSPPR